MILSYLSYLYLLVSFVYSKFFEILKNKFLILFKKFYLEKKKQELCYKLQLEIQIKAN